MRPMLRARAGRIVGIGSIAALAGDRRPIPPYAATKGALIAYARTLAIETAKRGVTVNVIAPVFVRHRHARALRPVSREHGEADPAGRFCRPEEVAGLAAFLMTPPAAYVTRRDALLDRGGADRDGGVHR